MKIFILLVVSALALSAPGCHRDEDNDTYVVKKTYHEVVDVVVVNEQVVEVIVQCDCSPSNTKCKIKGLHLGDKVHVRCEDDQEE